jgi:hypothetical protein
MPASISSAAARASSSESFAQAASTLAAFSASPRARSSTDNAALTDISLDALTSVAGSLTIANTGATRIDLGSLQTVNRLEISGNTKLTTFDGLSASIIKGDFILRGNTALASLGLMSSVSRVDGAMFIEGNNALKNLDAFSNLSFITSSLTVMNNTSLESLGRFNRLAGIGTTVAITGNSALPYCAAHEIDHCVNSGAVTVSNNKSGSPTQCTCVCQTTTH